jgi:hypothetical protein
VPTDGSNCKYLFQTAYFTKSLLSAGHKLCVVKLKWIHSFISFHPKAIGDYRRQNNYLNCIFYSLQNLVKGTG